MLAPRALPSGRPSQVKAAIHVPNVSESSFAIFAVSASVGPGVM